MYNATITCIVMDQPATVHVAANLKPFKSIDYGISGSLVWFVIKAPEMSRT